MTHCGQTNTEPAWSHYTELFAFHISYTLVPYGGGLGLSVLALFCFGFSEFSILKLRFAVFYSTAVCGCYGSHYRTRFTISKRCSRGFPIAL